MIIQMMSVCRLLCPLLAILLRQTKMKNRANQLVLVYNAILTRSEFKFSRGIRFLSVLFSFLVGFFSQI